MRSPRENNRPNITACRGGVFFPALAAFFICTGFLLKTTYKVPQKKLVGTWQYVKVEKNGKSVFEIGNNDTMNLTAEGHFNYVIQKPGKQAKGTWKIISVPKDSSSYKSALRFYYETKDRNHERIFNLCKLSANELCIREGALTFIYKKRK